MSFLSVLNLTLTLLASNALNSQGLVSSNLSSQEVLQAAGGGGENQTFEQLPAKFHAHIVGLFVSSSELPVYRETMKPTLEMALEEVSKRFPTINFTLAVRQGSNACLTNKAGAHAAEAYYKDGAKVFIGPACSVALDSVGRMASYWNLPVFTAGGISAEFANKQLYSSLTRLSFSLGE